MQIEWIVGIIALALGIVLGAAITWCICSELFYRRFVQVNEDWMKHSLRASNGIAESWRKCLIDRQRKKHRA